MFVGTHTETYREKNIIGEEAINLKESKVERNVEEFGGWKGK